MKQMIVTALLMLASLLGACQASPIISKPSTHLTTPTHSPNWASRYLALIESGQSMSHQDYQALYQDLNAIAKVSGATYVYLIMPISSGVPSINGDPEDRFILTIDGSDEPDVWGTVYDPEVQFTEAWHGQASVARSAWNDDDGTPLWSAFAPLYDHHGKVVALLGIDYPVTNLIKKYPQWNRDDKHWNGFTDQITGEIPSPIAKQRKILQNMVKNYAFALNHSAQ